MDRTRGRLHCVTGTQSPRVSRRCYLRIHHTDTTLLLQRDRRQTYVRVYKIAHKYSNSHSLQCRTLWCMARPRVLVRDRDRDREKDTRTFEGGVKNIPYTCTVCSVQL